MIWPMILAAGTAVAVLLVDLVFPRWYMPFGVALLGSLATAVSPYLVQKGRLSLLCAEADRCSYVLDDRARLIAVLIAVLTAFALLLYLPGLRAGDAPAGEVGFLLASAMTGGVVLGGAGDLITLIVALETLTLPLYALVALHRRRDGAAAAVTFFTTSIVATAISLLGAALLQLASGSVHLPFTMRHDLAGGLALAIAGLILLLTGFGFKVAAVPLHAWAPTTYDGAPVPVAAYLSTASKLGGVIAILYVADAAADTDLRISAGGTLAALATLSLVIGTLVALRQDRTVRLLAWSSVAQAGFILAPLGGLLMSPSPDLFAASLAYTLFFLALEFGAFSGVVALRPNDDGGVLEDLRGVGRAAPWRATMLAFALIGLAGLPPVLSGLFAKITVIRALLDVDSIWLALVVALASVVGLAVYWRPLAAMYRGSLDDRPAISVWPFLPLAAATIATVVLSFAPQLTMSLWE